MSHQLRASFGLERFKFFHLVGVQMFCRLISKILLQLRRFTKFLQLAQRCIGFQSLDLFVALLYDRAALVPHSEIVALIGDAPTVEEAQVETAVLCVLQEIHWQLHRSFCQYQSVCEQRRQLAFDVGETAQRLTDALCATGWSEQDARNADVHQLSNGPVR